MKKIIEIIKKKWLRDTFLTILLIVIIFAAYFGINIGIQKLNLEDIDTTTDKIYSISDATKTKLEGLDKDVNVLLINLSYYNYITEYANKYTQLNSHITIEKVDDLTSRSDLMDLYSLDSTDSLIVISSGERETILTLDDLYTYDYNTYEQIDVTEEAITNAIVEVTIEEKPVVYFLTGNNMYDMQYFQLVMEDIKSESNEVKELNLLVSGAVPEDCDCLVITTLSKDLSEVEKDEIIKYINNGGRILLLCDANVGNKDLTNFNEILALYGFDISKSILMEGDQNKMVYGSPEFVIADIQDVINQNVKTSMTMCVIDAGKVTFQEEDKLEELGVSYKVIAQASDTAFLRSNFSISTLSKTTLDEDASNGILGALVTKKIDDEKSSELIVYSNAVFATNQPVSMNGSYSIYANKLFNNDDVAVNSVAYLTKRTDTITIRKDADSVTYTVTQVQHNIITTIIFTVPVLIIIAGIIVWQVRRRKK